MLLQEAACPEAADWLLRIFGGMVLLCLASHAVSLLRRPPRGSHRRAPRRHAPPGERPPRAAPSAFSCCCATGLQKSPSRSQLPRSSDHSSAWLASASGPQPPPPPPPPARPARILVCSVRREAVGTRAPLGQVIYDARRPPPSHPWKSPAWLQ
ncbi:uncharacterized protein LOC143825838 isoform X1 [Paroedura picta]|uniref:uncharacterized protein LOC143825838 isoform X1 n=1 Tax=Paroedura picta TaxID=143630 RepID=UPI0040574A07